MAENNNDSDEIPKPLYVYCHECESRIGIALSESEARVEADHHKCDNIAWDTEPIDSQDTEDE